MTMTRTMPTHRAGTPAAVFVGFLVLADVVVYVLARTTLHLRTTEVVTIQVIGAILAVLALRSVVSFCTPYKRVNGEAPHGAAAVFCLMGSAIYLGAMVIGHLLK